MLLYEKYLNQLSNIKHEISEVHSHLDTGITIVIPIYDGEQYLQKCLTSILNQKITTANFEVILIFNGKFSSDINYFYNHVGKFKELDVTVLINDIASAGAARNMGISYAKYTHVTFIDVDDYISPNFIQSAYNMLENNTILYTQIHNVENKDIYKENNLNFEVVNSSKKKNPSLMDLNKISTITACKIIPKKFLLSQKFRINLKSGEDTVYFSELFVNNRPKLKVIPIEEDAIYFRVIRKNSVSRKSYSFDFLIYQRIEILEILDELYSIVKNQQAKRLIRSKYLAQIVFMNNYLKENISEHKNITNLIKKMNFKHFDYSVLNRELSKILVVSYCFPPYSDTSATIIAKRILNNNKIVDVASNNMNNIRKKEPSLYNLIRHLLGKNKITNEQASFSNSYYLDKYIDDAFNVFSTSVERYEEIYSRAMFPVSHFPPLFMKILKPEVKWTAEFSDPLLVDINSKVRYSDIGNNNLVQYLSNEALGDFSRYVDNNLFNLMEIIPFALADKIVFTNVNQMETMINRFNEEEKDFIRNKSIISKHPTLGDDYYEMIEAENKFDTSVINVGYFGNFYETRSYKQFVHLVEYLNEKFKYQFKLHLFTNVEALTEDNKNELDNKNVNLYPYLSFLEFLNTTKSLDILMINDAQTKGIKDVNPYLPSKLSDYIGSGTPIISFVEKGSTMSTIDGNLTKIDLGLFDNDSFKLDDHTHNEIKNLIANITNEKERYFITKEKEKIFLNNNNFTINASLDLSLSNIIKNSWMLQPGELPIKVKNDYTLKFINKSNSEKILKVQSFYSMKDVIRVYIYRNDEEESVICISKFRENKNFFVKPNDSITIKLKYKKYYNQKSFLKAGRLKLTML